MKLNYESAEYYPRRVFMSRLRVRKSMMASTEAGTSSIENLVVIDDALIFGH